MYNVYIYNVCIYIYTLCVYIYTFYIYIYIYHYRSIQFATNQTQLEPQPPTMAFSTPPSPGSLAPLNWWYTEICPACLPGSFRPSSGMNNDHQPTKFYRPFGMAFKLPIFIACWWCLKYVYPRVYCTTISSLARNSKWNMEIPGRWWYWPRMAIRSPNIRETRS